MKKFLSSLSCFFLVLSPLYSQSLVASVEAESGVLTGVSIAADATSSGGNYVTGFDNTGDKVTVTVTVPNTANYNLVVRYRSIYGDKTQDLWANGTFVGSIVFNLSSTFTDLSAGTISLNAGNNTITILKNWGYMDVDKFSIYSMTPNVFDITSSLIDGQATVPAKNLYKRLRSWFGKNIISGSTGDYYNNIKQITGKSPLLRSWEFQSYSPMYPYKWENGGHVFGAVDNHDAEHAISWYNNTGNKGIVTIQWHWSSPSGGTAGTNTFYTNQTTFDVSKAVIAGTQENTDALRDIDAIAVQLKKLSDAGVPVLWRPLHEAGGGWFWWGAKGSASAKALYDIMYNRLTVYHNLHNLIWVWSTPEADWYPGNDKVDIIGYDSYPGAYNYTTQKNMFDHLYDVTAGKKLVAMSENGPVPDVANMFSSKATWSWFMTWDNLATDQNTTQHLIDVYDDQRVLTLENYIIPLPVGLSAFTARAEGNKVKIDWTTDIETNSQYFEIKHSVNGVDFYPMATKTAHGNSSVKNNYTIFNNNPSSGMNYYQLIQYDLDGRANNHGVRTINFTGSATASVSVYPNPLNDHPGIMLTNFYGKKIKVKLIDMAGKILLDTDINTSIGKTYYQLPLKSKLVAGQYFLSVEGDGLRESVKLIY